MIRNSVKTIFTSLLLQLTLIVNSYSFAQLSLQAENSVPDEVVVEITQLYLASAKSLCTDASGRWRSDAVALPSSIVESIESSSERKLGDDEKAINCPDFLALEVASIKDGAQGLEAEEFYACATQDWNVMDQLTLARDMDLVLEEIYECKGKSQPTSECVNDLICNAASTVSFGLGDVITEKLGMECPKSTDTNCLSTAWNGLVKNLIGTAEFFWDVAAGGFSWIGNKIGNFFSGSEEAEDAASDKLHLLSSAEESFVDKLLDDPVNTLKDGFANLMTGIGNYITESIYDNFACAKFEKDANGEDTCVEPVTSFECATCGQKLNMACGIVGVVGGEVLIGLLTAGTINAAKVAGKGIMVGARAVSKSRLFSPLGKAIKIAGVAGAKIVQTGKGFAVKIGPRVVNLQKNKLVKAFSMAAKLTGKTAMYGGKKVAQAVQAYGWAADKLTAMTMRGVANQLDNIPTAFNGYLGKTLDFATKRRASTALATSSDALRRGANYFDGASSVSSQASKASDATDSTASASRNADDSPKQGELFDENGKTTAQADNGGVQAKEPEQGRLFDENGKVTAQADNGGVQTKAPEQGSLFDEHGNVTMEADNRLSRQSSNTSITSSSRPISENFNGVDDFRTMVSRDDVVNPNIDFHFTDDFPMDMMAVKDVRYTADGSGIMISKSSHPEHYKLLEEKGLSPNLNGDIVLKFGDDIDSSIVRHQSTPGAAKDNARIQRAYQFNKPDKSIIERLDETQPTMAKPVQDRARLDSVLSDIDNMTQRELNAFYARVDNKIQNGVRLSDYEAAGALFRADLINPSVRFNGAAGNRISPQAYDSALDVIRNRSQSSLTADEIARGPSGKSQSRRAAIEEIMDNDRRSATVAATDSVRNTNPRPSPTEQIGLFDNVDDAVKQSDNATSASTNTNNPPRQLDMFEDGTDALRQSDNSATNGSVGLSRNRNTPQTSTTRNRGLEDNIRATVVAAPAISVNTTTSNNENVAVVEPEIQPVEPTNVDENPDNNSDDDVEFNIKIEYSDNIIKVTHVEPVTACRLQKNIPASVDDDGEEVDAKTTTLGAVENGEEMEVTKERFNFTVSVECKTDGDYKLATTASSNFPDLKISGEARIPIYKCDGDECETETDASGKPFQLRLNPAPLRQFAPPQGNIPGAPVLNTL
ncbi:hypothetical protein [Halobacteriovorax sp. DPLXC-1]|uniref:hypothetical protein n=1 Tax=Halobacteriovorax sp. DPLXC-1 TaxID=3110771 RepID=UPI002FF0B960